MGQPTLRPVTTALQSTDIEAQLSLELVRVVEAAAIAAARTMGKGDRPGSDHAAVEAMRGAFEELPIAGTIVVIGWIVLFAHGNQPKDHSLAQTKDHVIPQANIEPFLGAIEASKRSVLAELTSFHDFLRAQMPNSADGVRYN